jgi:hypothetical protein
MRTFRLKEWALMAAARLFPHWFGRKSRPVVLRPRKLRPPVRLTLDVYESREAPTALDGIGSALLGPSRPSETLPALVQSVPASTLALPEIENRPSALFTPGGIASYEAFGQAQNSPLSSADEHPPSVPTLMPWTFAAVAFTTNLDGMPSPDSLWQDPFALDGLLASRAHPPASLGDGAPVAHAGTPAYPGSDGGGGGGSRGSGGGSSSSPQQNGSSGNSNASGEPNMLFPPAGPANAPAGAAGVTPSTTPASATNPLLPAALPTPSSGNNAGTSSGSLGWPGTASAGPAPDHRAADPSVSPQSNIVPLIAVCSPPPPGAVTDVLSGCGMAPVISSDCS